MKKAEENLQNAESYQMGKGNKKSEITVAREAVQTAEDARMITVKKIDAESRENERRMSADAQADSKATADEATRQKERAEADTLRANSEAAKAKAEAAEAQAAAGVAVAQALADTEQARLAARNSEARAQSAESDKSEMRARLMSQLNLILETRDTARGLIVNMSDVLFDTGKFMLKQATREKLAKVAGVLIAYPGLTIEVDGHTDNVGGDDFNQTLSDQRATSVRDYLVKSGVGADSVLARGFGKTQPIDSNDTAAGRQMNRRVELVVSGDSIGGALISPTPAASLNK